MVLFDSNQDSFVSRTEFEALNDFNGGNIDANSMNTMFSMLDTNRDQKISWNEAYNFAQANDNQNGLRGAISFYTKTEQVNIIYDAFDFNNDGYLSFSEVKALLVYTYGSATDSDANWFISLIDANGDRYISWYEFYNAIQ